MTANELAAAIVFLPEVAAVLILTVTGVMRLRETRQARREARRRALTRHPAQQSRTPRLPRRIPGRPVDGKPLSDEELAQFTGIMLRSTTRDQGRRPQ